MTDPARRSIYAAWWRDAQEQADADEASYALSRLQRRDGERDDPQAAEPAREA